MSIKVNLINLYGDNYDYKTPANFKKAYRIV